LYIVVVAGFVDLRVTMGNINCKAVSHAEVMLQAAKSGDDGAVTQILTLPKQLKMLYTAQTWVRWHVRTCLCHWLFRVTLAHLLRAFDLSDGPCMQGGATAWHVACRYVFAWIAA